jgi:transposase
MYQAKKKKLVSLPRKEVSDMIIKEALMDIRSMAKQGYSNRQIAEKTGIDRRTVKKYLQEGTLPVYRKINRNSKLEPFYPLIQGWLSQEDFQATRIHELLVAEGFDGAYHTVRRYVKTLKEQRDHKAYIRFETMPGQQAQVDFGDFQVIEPNGSTKTVYAFVMALGFSRHTYVEFIDRCTLPNFLACHQHAFGFFGGVPAEILYDNMKNVVIERSGTDVRWNPAFEAFALHYGFQPRVAPPYAPWVKGKVERPIKYVRERFWRGYVYQDLARTNQDIRTWLMTVAFNRIHGTTRQKVCDRFNHERRALGSLPEHPCDISLKFYRKVHKDCQLCFNGNRYVVPHEFAGKRVLLRVKDDIIRIFNDDHLITLYRIPKDKGQTIGHPQFYRRLRKNREQLARKYRKPFGKAKATRGLINADRNVEVMRRSLAIYEEVTL